MTVSASDTIVHLPLAMSASVTDDTLTVELSDGRSVSVPLAWYPRLLYASGEDRLKWRLIAQGEGIHWPDVDEDISVESLIAGRPSAESPKSLQRWLAGRKTKT
jgi:hypothetical protein